jgi:hypothetical protein
MISMQISQDCRVAEFGSGSPTCCERCQRQVAEAQKEMSAFVITVGRKWGGQWLLPVQRSIGSSWSRASARCWRTVVRTGAT